jgi:hypothetical protein
VSLVYVWYMAQNWGMEGFVNITFPLFSKPCTQNLYILRHCTNILYTCISKE